MPGFKRAPLEPGPLSDLMDALHQLHLAAGYPSLRDLQRDIGGRDAPSHAAIHKVFTGGRLPTWRLVEALVRAMARRAGSDEKVEAQRFKALWTKAASPRSAETDFQRTIFSGAGVSKPEAAGAAVEQFSYFLSELMPDTLEEIEAVGLRSAVGSFRVPTGFADLDALLGGWSQGYLIVVGGRPSSGKTTLLLDFCRAASVKYRLRTLFISGETNNREIQSRLLSAHARVPSHVMRTGQMSDDDWTRLATIMSALADTPMQIATPAEFQIEQVIAEATILVQKSGLKLLLIDSLQWITDRDASPLVSAESTLWRLKTLAETLKIPVIISAYAQRRKEGFLTGNPIAQLTHGDAIERVADVVILLDRPDQDELEHPRVGETDLRVVKNRNGPTATVTVGHQFHYCRFVDLGFGKYQIFPAQKAAEPKRTPARDRDLYHRLLEQLPSDGQVIDWLKNNFVLKHLPVDLFETVTQVERAMSLEVIGFDDSKANDAYNDLKQAIEKFCGQINWHTWPDEENHWLQVPNEWRDREDRTQYDAAMTAIADARNAFISAYDRFVKTCHQKGFDRDGGTEAAKS